MKKLIVFAWLLATLLSHAAHADTSPAFVRIACVTDTGLFEIEARNLHDNVAGGPRNRGALAAAGFHDPHKLAFSCVLGGVTYAVVADQGEVTNAMCGGDPEVNLTVTRNGAPILSNVVFGESCHGLPSVRRLTVGDGPGATRGRETQLCYASGKEDAPDTCDWTFGDARQFNTRFPVDQNRLDAIVAHQEKR